VLFPTKYPTNSLKPDTKPNIISSIFRQELHDSFHSDVFVDNVVPGSRCLYPRKIFLALTEVGRGTAFVTELLVFDICAFPT